MSEFRVYTCYVGPEKRRALHILPKIPIIGAQAKGIFIPENEAWIYSEEHNPNFERDMFNATMRVCMAFNYEANTRRMADLATQIQGRIEDLQRMKPYIADRGAAAVAEGRLEDRQTGESIPFEVTEDGRIRSD